MNWPVETHRPAITANLEEERVSCKNQLEVFQGVRKSKERERGRDKTRANVGRSYPHTRIRHKVGKPRAARGGVRIRGNEIRVS